MGFKDIVFLQKCSNVRLKPTAGTDCTSVAGKLVVAGKSFRAAWATSAVSGNIKHAFVHGGRGLGGSGAACRTSGLGPHVPLPPGSLSVACHTVTAPHARPAVVQVWPRGERKPSRCWRECRRGLPRICPLGTWPTQGPRVQPLGQRGGSPQTGVGGRGCSVPRGGPSRTVAPALCPIFAAEPLAEERFSSFFFNRLHFLEWFYLVHDKVERREQRLPQPHTHTASPRSAFPPEGRLLPSVGRRMGVVLPHLV